VTGATLVEDGFIYTGDADGWVLPSGSILIVGDRIAAIGDHAAVARAVAGLDPATAGALQTLDAGSMMVLPGLVNGHWHEMFGMRVAFKGALRGSSDRGDEPGFLARGGNIPLASVLFDSLYDVARGLTAAEAEAIATYSMWTQLRCGTTTLGDAGSVNRPAAMAAAARRLGIRAALSTWATDTVCRADETRPVRTRDADDVLSEVKDLITMCAEDQSGLLRARPSAVYVTNLSDALGTSLGELGRAHAVPLAIHVGALRNEREAMQRFYGTTPIRRLADMGMLSPELMAVHTAFFDEEERKLLLEHGVRISYSPAKYGTTGESALSETGLIMELAADGADVSLSTDGAVFPLGGMPEAMRAAWQSTNEMAADNTVLPPTTALRMATASAAAGLGWADEIGSLEPGKQADLVLVPRTGWRYLLNPRPLEAFLTLGGSSDVDTVMVAGRVLLRGGKWTGGDETMLEEAYLDAVRSFSGRCLGVGSDTLGTVFDRRSGKENR